MTDDRTPIVGRFNPCQLCVRQPLISFDPETKYVARCVHLEAYGQTLEDLQVAWNAKNPAPVHLTKREQFAMAAMQGIMSAKMCERPKDICKLAVEFADALIAELEKSVCLN